MSLNLRRLRLGLALPVVGALLFISAPTASGTTPTAAPQALPADDAAAAQLAADWSVPIAEARRRVGLQSEISELTDQLQADNPAFAGAYIDQGHGGKVVIRLTDGTREARMQQAADGRGLGREVKFKLATRSFTTLLEVQRRVNARIDQAGPPARTGMSTVPKYESNRVEVTQVSSAGPEQRALVADLENEFGDAIDVRQTDAAATPFSCVYPNCDPPARGGAAITTSFATAGGCSAGFVGTSTADSSRYMITAGHCAVDYGGAGVSWNLFYNDQVGHAMGTMQPGYIFGPDGDMAVIGLHTAFDPRNWVVVNSAASPGYPTQYTEDYTITNRGGYSSVPMTSTGQYLCHTGKTIGTRCGKLSGSPYSAMYTTTTVNGLATVNATACQGDSGGPVFVSHTAYGVLSGGYGPNVGMVDGKQCTAGFAYQGIAEIVDRLHVYPVSVESMSSSCGIEAATLPLVTEVAQVAGCT